MPKMIVDGGIVKVDGRTYRVDVFLDVFEKMKKRLSRMS